MRPASPSSPTARGQNSKVVDLLFSRNVSRPTKVPRNIQDDAHFVELLERHQQAHRGVHNHSDEADDGGDVRKLDLWLVQQKFARTDRKSNVCNFCLYIFAAFLLVAQIFQGPNAAGLLRHREALEDLLLDEEFPGAVNALPSARVE